MRNILFVVYIVFVASLSVTVKAKENSIPLIISSINFDKENGLLQVQGHYPNPCVENTYPRLNVDADGRLIIEVFGDSTAEVCIQVIGPSLLVGIELDILKVQLKSLGLNDGDTYELFDRAGNSLAHIDFSEVFSRIEFPATKLTGILESENGQYYLDDMYGQKIQVLSALSHIERLVGAPVTLTGHLADGHLQNYVLESKTEHTPRFIATEVRF